MKLIRKFVSFLPTLLTALVLAIIVWVSSVTASDPNQIITYETPIKLEICLLYTSPSPRDRG